MTTVAENTKQMTAKVYQNDQVIELPVVDLGQFGFNYTPPLERSPRGQPAPSTRRKKL